MNKRKSRDEPTPSTSAKKHRKEIEPVDTDIDETSNDSDGSISSIAPSEIRRIRCSETRSGKILGVKLRNFMCHRNLAVELNSKSNIIVGRNGSGKSAILTALIIGLGARANATDRSSSTKQLIKRGEPSATIEVEISNDGSETFEHDKYGDRIHIVRTILASGSSTYKLKSANNTVISTSRNDLLKIMMYLNIQVDNPVCVLTQDASRGFLRDSDPSKRYQLFRRATQMDVILEKLNSCREQLIAARTQLEYQNDITDTLKKTKDDVKEKYLEMQSVSVIKDELTKLKCQQNWTGVFHQEKLVSNIQSSMDESVEKRMHFVSENQRIENEERDLKNLIEGIQNGIKNHHQIMREFDDKCAQSRELFKEKCNLFSQFERNLNRLRETKRRILDDLNSLKEHLESQTSTNEVHKLRAQNEADLAECTARSKELESIMSGCIRDIEMFKNTITHKREKFDELKAKRREIVNDIDSLERRKKQINLKGRHNLQLYGDYIPALMADINRLYKNKRFSELPLGPIGSYIEVTDAKYVRYVEEICKGLLSAFCVNNANDRAVLLDLLKKSYPQAKISIITFKFLKKTYDTTGKCVRGDANSIPVMDLIKTDNPNIMNCLIDQCRVDSILITDRQDHAISITSRQENIPKNLNRVVVTDPYTEYYPAPVYRSYSKKYAMTAKFLQLDMSQRERYIESELVKHNHRRVQFDEELKHMEKQINDNDKLLNERQERRGQLQPELVRLRMKIKDLQEFEYPAEDEATIMENEVNEQTKRVDALDVKIEEEMEKIKQSKVDRDTADQNLAQLRLEKHKSSSSVEDRGREIDKLNEKMCYYASAKRKNDANLKAHQDAIDKFASELAAQTHKLETLTRSAAKIGERVEATDESSENIIRKMKSLERKIDRITGSSDTLEMLKMQLDKAMHNYGQNKNIVSALTDTIKHLRTATRMRQIHIQKFIHYMSSQISYQFKVIMELRGFDGELCFDNKEQTLDLRIIPRDKDVAVTSSKTSSLSGGERSYSTVALLIALWYCVDSPFYFLDEYDVFTDQVNRMYMTKLLLSQANQNDHKQYTFLTPQDISDLTATDTLSILRMADPERN